MSDFNSNNDAPKISKLLFSQESNQSIFKPISGDCVTLNGNAVTIFDATQPHFDQAESISATENPETIAQMDKISFESLNNYFYPTTRPGSGAPSKHM